MRKIKGIFIESDSSILSKYKTSFDESFDITVFKDSNSSLSYIIENNLNIYFYVVRISNENEDSVKFFADKIKEINPQIKLVIIESENGALDEKKYNDALIFTKQIDAEHIVSSIKKYIENIDDNQKRNLFILLSKAGLRTKQLKLINEHPTRRDKIVFRLEAEKIISTDEAVKYLGVTTDEFFKSDFCNWC